MNKKEAIVTGVVTFIVLLLGSKILFNPFSLISRDLSTSICPEVKYSFNTEKPLIALAINESPDLNSIVPHTTLSILDVLANHQAQATFFIVVNKAKDFPQLITSIVDQGHELGIYVTNDRSNMRLGNKPETELIEANKFLGQFAAINWFYPSRGRCRIYMRKIAKRHKYKIALGSVLLDNPADSPSYIKQNIRPGSILVLHDSDKKSDRQGKTTVKILNKLIPQLQQQGYGFVTLSELDRESRQVS